MITRKSSGFTRNFSADLNDYNIDFPHLSIGYKTPCEFEQIELPRIIKGLIRKAIFALADKAFYPRFGKEKGTVKIASSNQRKQS